MNELKNYVDGIAKDLKALYAADFTEEEIEQKESNDEPYDLYSYFNDALDVEYTIDCNGDFLGARIAVTLGGPNVFVDTRRGIVDGFWGCDHEEAWIPAEICNEINVYFEDAYECIRNR